jgi:hypothetical protein
LAPLLAVPAGQALHEEGEETFRYVPEDQVGPPEPPEVVQEEEPALSVKKLAGHGAHVEAEVAEFAVLKVLRGQGVGTPEPSGQ